MFPERFTNQNCALFPKRTQIDASKSFIPKIGTLETHRHYPDIGNSTIQSARQTENRYFRPFNRRPTSTFAARIDGVGAISSSEEAARVSGVLKWWRMRLIVG